MKLELTNTFLKKIGAVADEHSIEAYVVGGYVRDKLLGKEVSDIDIVVIGNGIEFAESVAVSLKQRKIVTYEKFGTAMMPTDEGKIEFVGARKESYHRESRNPIVEVGTLEEDLSRRDFTINTLAISINGKTWGEMIDPFNGETDLRNRIIRTPLDPMTTFDDDPLRIMRAIRFASQLGFSIEEKTLSAIPEMKKRLTIISQERITEEFMKIMSSPKPSVGLRMMFDTGILHIVFPEVADLSGVDQRQDHHHKDVFLHTCQVLDNISMTTENIHLRMAALLHDIAKPKTKKFIENVQ